MPGVNDSKCILVIGATAGIGRALALAMHKLPTKPDIIVAGRRQERLDELVQQGEGRIHAVQVDVSKERAELKKFVDGVLERFPKLDTVVFSSGVQHQFDFKNPESIDLGVAFHELNINYISVVILITLFLPHLLKLASTGQPTFLVPITSGLAIVPLGNVPNYSATKAALHNLSLSLHQQLQGTNVHVMEIIPPLVESELHDNQGTTEALSKHWMPLDEFTGHTIEGLQKGEFQNIVPAIRHVWEQCEAPKLAMLDKARQLFASK